MNCLRANRFGLYVRRALLALVIATLSAGCEIDSRSLEPAGGTDTDFEAASRAAPMLGSESRRATQAEFSAAAPSPSNPVTAAMAIRPDEAQPGDTVELVVHVRIARAHYVHASAGREKFVPLEMSVNLPDGLEAEGDWQFPRPDPAIGSGPVYRDSVMLRRSLKIRSDAPPAPMIVAGELRYQVCNDELCWPSGKMDLTTSLTVKRR